MSSVPTKPKIIQLQNLLEQYNQLRGESIALQQRIKDDSRELEKVNEKFVAAKRSILLSVEGMDCREPGNNGWENRFVEMLGMLIEENEQSVQRRNDQ